MSFLPEDPEMKCGYGPFGLPLDHPFTRACILHDHEFELAHEGRPDKTKDKSDIDLFYRWVLIAKAAATEAETIDLFWDIVKYWPLARVGGNLMWDGDPKPNEMTYVEAKNILSFVDNGNSDAGETPSGIPSSGVRRAVSGDSGSSSEGS